MCKELETVFSQVNKYWPSLISFLNRIMELPSDSKALYLCYGAFDNDSQVNELLESRGKLLEIQSKLIITKETLNTNTIPSGQYGFVFFLKNCIAASTKAADSFIQISELAVPLQTQDLFLIKQLLVSETGIAQQCEEVSNHCVNMEQETLELLAKFTEEAAKINSSPLINESNQAIGSLRYRVSEIEKQIGEMERKLNSHFLTKEKLIQIKAQLISLQEQKEDLLSQIKKKTLLTADFNLFTNDLLTAQKAFQVICQLLVQVRPIYSELAFRAKNTSNLANKSQLSNKGWLDQTLQIGDSKEKLEFICTGFNALLDFLTG